MYLSLAVLFGFRITSFLNEVKRIDSHSLYQAYQIGQLERKTKGVLGIPKTFLRTGLLAGIESFSTSARLKSSKYPYFVFHRGIFTISGTNSKKAFLSSLNEITTINDPNKKPISYLGSGSVQDTLNKFIRCFLFRWAKRKSSFCLKELIININKGLLPLYKFLKRWKLGSHKVYRRTEEFPVLDDLRVCKEEPKFLHYTFPGINMGLALLRTNIVLRFSISPLFSTYTYQQTDKYFTTDEFCVRK